MELHLCSTSLQITDITADSPGLRTKTGSGLQHRASETALLYRQQPDRRVQIESWSGPAPGAEI